jgi:cytoplasmic tRNA 2-thiolation protein 2
METYKVLRSTLKAPRKFLLPLSFGPSSTCLLYILDNQLQTQLVRMGRVTYELLLVHVDSTGISPESSDLTTLLEMVKTRFPTHTFISKKLEEVLHLDNFDLNAISVGKPQNEASSLPDSDRLRSLLESAPSATSRADIVSVFLLRLLVHTAKANDCESILFGDSTTRLAEKTLAETAKGRGISLPWQISDGMSPLGVNFHYPLRDLLKKELITFSSLTSPPLTDLIMHQSTSSQVSASSKSTTIDDLMAQYFESVEESFPSIVTNVVRTLGKLSVPVFVGDRDSCGICRLPVHRETNEIYGWTGDQNSNAVSNQPQDKHSLTLCYGCARSINGWGKR